jgi:hypothetical protein
MVTHIGESPMSPIPMRSEGQCESPIVPFEWAMEPMSMGFLGMAEASLLACYPRRAAQLGQAYPRSGSLAQLKRGGGAPASLDHSW